VQQSPHGRPDKSPVIGDRVEIRRGGVIVRGLVDYAEGLRVLVMWDDGSSSSLRIGLDAFETVEPGAANARIFDRMLLESRDPVRLPIERDAGVPAKPAAAEDHQPHAPQRISPT
jgi:hypothetical protein